MPYRIPAAANTPYRPSNGTEGMMFEEEFCNYCRLEDGCEIVGNAMFFEIGDIQYPKEWTHDAGGCPTCTAFVPEKRESGSDEGSFPRGSCSAGTDTRAGKTDCCGMQRAGR